VERGVSCASPIAEVLFETLDLGSYHTYSKIVDP
jgi:hypothetical protein